MRHILSEERGSSHIIILGLVWGMFLLSILFFDFFGVFITKRISQTSADAAALAATKEAVRVYQAELKSEVNRQVSYWRPIYRSEAHALVAASEGTLTFEEAWQIVMTRHGVPSGLERKLWEPSQYTVDVAEALNYFYRLNRGQITRIMCNAIENNPGVKQAAVDYARKNGADREVKMIFPYKGEFQVYVSVKRPTAFMFLKEEQFNPGESDVYSEAAAAIKIPSGITYYRSYCGSW